MNAEELNAQVKNIAGSKQELNSFIERYKPFIAACTRKVTGRYVRYGVDDELSIALCAFEKAINSYSEDKGNFLSFAGVLIRNSVIDYLRKEKKLDRLVYIEDFNSNEDMDRNVIDNIISTDEFVRKEEELCRKQEIAALKDELSTINITFMDMEKASSKSKKTKRICNSIILAIMENDNLLREVHKQKQLPMNILEKTTCIKRKGFERHRKYIMGVIIVLNGKYTMLREYIDKEVRMRCWGDKLMERRGKI